MLFAWFGALLAIFVVVGSLVLLYDRKTRWAVEGRTATA
jgi:heme/copper-type cytochrome/quinol oxidase subunit 4